MHSIFKRLICLSLLLLAAPVLAYGQSQEYTVAQTPALFYAEATFASTPTLMQQAETVVELSQLQVENTRWSEVLWNGQVYFIPSDQLIPVSSPNGEDASLAALLTGYSAQAGTRYVQWGAYAYETNGMTRPILWRVLDTDGQTALLLSEMVLDAEPYLLEEAEDPQYELQWDLSHLKAYLQGTFLPRAFSVEEQAVLSSTRMGKVFILSSTDYQNARYGFQSGATVEDAARQAVATPYARSKGAEERNGHATYWTCSLSAKSMQMVKTGGSLGAAREERTNVGVRVAVSLMLPGVQVSGGEGSPQSPYLLQVASQALSPSPPDSPETLMRAFLMPAPVSPVYHDNTGRNPVYSGPGEHTYRAVSAKGTPVYESGSDWITVLGREGNWALIEYAISTGFRRGYVQGRLIPPEVWSGLASIPSAGYAGRLHYDSYLFDDVTQRGDSCRLAALPGNSVVRMLGYDQPSGMFYVESSIDGLSARGYVPADAVWLE